MTCRGQGEYVELMAPSLQGPQGRPPAFLPAIRDRPIDVVFSGCVSEFEQRWCKRPLAVLQSQCRIKHDSAAAWKYAKPVQRNVK